MAQNILLSFPLNNLNKKSSKHEQKLLDISGLDYSDFLKIYDLVISRIKFVHHLLIGEENISKAHILTQNIDPDDTLFVALAMQFRIRLWTGDKKLIKGLRKQGYKQVITSEELFQVYIDKEYQRKQK